MPDTANKSPAQAPTITDKVGGLLTYGATNAATIGAPNLPGNDMDVGGATVGIIAHGINGIIQAFKMQDWFKQNKWAMWTALLLSVLFCLLLWHDDLRKAALNALATVAQTMLNYKPLNNIGVLPAGTDAVSQGEKT